MKITAVTTFHQEGMLTYGQRLIDSWQEKVDPNSKQRGWKGSYD